MRIIKRIISANFTTGRSGDTPKKIVLHTTAGSGSCFNLFNNPKVKASAHYLVFLSGDIEQYVEEKNTAWANSNGYINLQAISIEHEDSGHPADKVRTPQQYETSAQLVADICERYKIPCEYQPGDFRDGNSEKAGFWNWGINLHRQFANKTCPGGLDYQRIIKRANELIKLHAQPVTPTPPIDPIPTTDPCADIKAQLIIANTKLDALKVPLANLRASMGSTVNDTMSDDVVLGMVVDLLKQPTTSEPANPPNSNPTTEDKTTNPLAEFLAKLFRLLGGVDKPKKTE